MGGYAPGSGLISARIAATVGKQIFSALEAQAEAADPLDSAGAEAIVRQAIGAANTMVLDAIAQAGEMGSTLVVLLIHGDVAYVANIGDSRGDTIVVICYGYLIGTCRKKINCLGGFIIIRP